MHNTYLSVCHDDTPHTQLENSEEHIKALRVACYTSFKAHMPSNSINPAHLNPLRKDQQTIHSDKTETIFITIARAHLEC